jgi:hypothetical protein
MQKIELLSNETHIHGGDTGNVAARPIEADDQPSLDRIGTTRVHNRNGRSCGLGRANSGS